MSILAALGCQRLRLANINWLSHSVYLVVWCSFRGRKCSIYCKTPNLGPSKENGQLMLKRPELPDGFWGRAFKGKVREGVAGYLISSWTFF